TAFVRLRVLFFFQAEDGIRGRNVTGVQTCALPIFSRAAATRQRPHRLLIGSRRLTRRRRSARSCAGPATSRWSSRWTPARSRKKIGRASCREREWGSGGDGGGKEER